MATNMCSWIKKTIRRIPSPKDQIEELLFMPESGGMPDMQVLTGRLTAGAARASADRGSGNRRKPR